MRLLLPCLLSLFAAALPACLWDYDTLAQESRGKADLKAVIVGGFPRNPPLYYEMRLERVTKLLETSPDDLDAYDAAGVACDRLGRADEAIEWMARKQAAMERMGYDASKHEQPNHRYRYLANLGTFHAHRWFSNGAKREAMDDLKQGRELIAQAIKENPNAHFGREKYQLMVMDWVLGFDSVPRPEEREAKGFDTTAFRSRLTMLDVDPRDAYGHVSDGGVLSRLGLADAPDGIAGLVSLGAAWESVDVFNALAIALAFEGRQALALFARQRVEELWAKGHRSILPHNIWGSAEEYEHCILRGHQEFPIVKHQRQVEEEYKMLRTQADAWHDQRETFMLAQLREGQHPDTHPDFWSDFDGDPDRMHIPEPLAVSFWIDDFKTWFRDGGYRVVVPSLALTIVVSTILLMVLRRRYKHRREARRWMTPDK